MTGWSCGIWREGDEDEEAEEEGGLVGMEMRTRSVSSGALIKR